VVPGWSLIIVAPGAPPANDTNVSAAPPVMNDDFRHTPRFNDAFAAQLHPYRYNAPSPTSWTVCGMPRASGSGCTDGSPGSTRPLPPGRNFCDLR
jgi:hypothetical protein